MQPRGPLSECPLKISPECRGAMDGSRRCHSRDLSGINCGLVPPCRFITVTMQFAMVASAERDGELVTDLAAERAALCEAEVMGVGRLPSADQAGLLRDVTEVIAIADAPWLGEGERGFVDGWRYRGVVVAGRCFELGPFRRVRRCGRGIDIGLIV